jgi:Holliday junction DNA helicase RuvA
MISQIYGKVIQKNDSSLLIDVSGLCYEVFVPVTIMKAIEKDLKEDGMLRLVTYHYHQVEPSRNTPVLIGFLNEVEKEFFESLITVSGVGPKAALKALNLPISMIARAIDEGNLELLKSLPGIGQQRAKEIIAKLQGRVGKFGLIQDEQFGKEEPSLKEDLESEAIEVLLQLQYKRKEAHSMVRRALERAPQVKTVEELLNEVYKQRLHRP